MKKEIIEKLSLLITTAFGLIAALAWNGAIQAIFDKLYKAGGELLAMIIYAVIVTIIAVFATVWIGKISDRFNKP